ncbi:MAG: ComEA family DNA-binding protein [Actinomycetia bacterium]|nr:ComEA family DNA-binding protein [Actinomycetes bacterium]
MVSQQDQDRVGDRRIPPTAQVPTSAGSATRSPLPLPSTDRDRGRSSLVDRLDDVLISFDQARRRPVLALILGLTMMVLAGAGWWLGRADPATPVEAGIPVATSSVPSSAPVTTAPAPISTGSGGNGEVEPEPLLVHVAGAVINPGLVELEFGDRIDDAVTAAGGPSVNADLHQLNLAAPVSDGMQIRVPEQGEVAQHPAGFGGSGPISDGGGGEAGSVMVDVNRASISELESLPGIGPSLGQAIVDWREANGPFASVDALLSVPGIGPAKLAGLADQVSV